MTQPATAPKGAERSTLIEQIETAPRVADGKAASRKLADLLADAGQVVGEELAGEELAGAQSLAALFEANPAAHALLLAIADHSPYLWRLCTGDPARLHALLTTDPDARLAELIARTDESWHERHEGELMRALRLGKQELALLVGIADLGGVWSLEQVTEALAAYADAACACCVRWLLARAAEAGTLPAAEFRRSRARLRHGGDRARQARRARAELFLRHRRRGLLRPVRRAACRDVPRPAPFFVRLVKGLVKLLQERTPDGYVFRTDLRLRPDPGVHAHGRSRCLRLRLLRDRRPELGARGADQGAAGGRRPAHRRGVPGRTRAVHLAQIFRLRRHRRHPCHEAADPRRARARDDRGRRPQHQARARRHPRDRVLRPDPATRLRGPPAGPARQPDARHAVGAARRRLDLAGGRDELAEAYRFLRTIEHGCRCSPTSRRRRLPSDDEASLARFARFCGYADLRRFLQGAHRSGAACARSTMRGCSRKARSSGHGQGNLVFTGTTDDPETLATLRRMGFTEPAGSGGDRARLAFRAAAGGHQPARPRSADRTGAAPAGAFGAQRGPGWRARGVRQGAGPHAGRRGAVLHPEIAQAAALAVRRYPRVGAAPRRDRRKPAASPGRDHRPALQRSRAGCRAIEAGSRRPSASRSFWRTSSTGSARLAQHEIFLVGARTMSGTLSLEQAGAAYADVAEAVIRLALRGRRAALRGRAWRAFQAGEWPSSAWVGSAPAR